MSLRYRQQQCICEVKAERGIIALYLPAAPPPVSSKRLSFRRCQCSDRCCPEWQRRRRSSSKRASSRRGAMDPKKGLEAFRVAQHSQPLAEGSALASPRAPSTPPPRPPDDLRVILHFDVVGCAARRGDAAGCGRQAIATAAVGHTLICIEKNKKTINELSTQDPHGSRTH